MNLYNKYSDYLKTCYGQKVYKLPINLPVTCPNRISAGRDHRKGGCIFCAEAGTGFEALNSQIPVAAQLCKTKEKIQKKYNVHKFIAYFQNYTNTFLPLSDFKKYVEEAAQVSDIVEIAISTRPDCITAEYLDVLADIRNTYSILITIELGLQTANYHTLKQINRGHTLAEFLDAVLMIKPYHFTICTHVILNLPYDTIEDTVETAKIVSALHIPLIKIHSLYIAHNTVLCDLYNKGSITVCSKEEYIKRLLTFLEHLDPQMVIERLFSRIPEADSVFCNWGTSWWKLQDEVREEMIRQDSYQGKAYSYLGGAALKKLS